MPVRTKGVQQKHGLELSEKGAERSTQQAHNPGAQRCIDPGAFVPNEVHIWRARRAERCKRTLWECPPVRDQHLWQEWLHVRPVADDANVRQVASAPAARHPLRQLHVRSVLRREDVTTDGAWVQADGGLIEVEA